MGLADTQQAALLESALRPVREPVAFSEWFENKIARGHSIARCFRAMASPPKFTYLGFAVLLDDQRLNDDGLGWCKACHLADLHPGSRIAIWTRPLNEAQA